MEIQIVCGFLGAGKTTLLKNLVQQCTSDTAILVNELGEIGIDGTLIADGTNLKVIEMPSGCVCCTLKENLVEAVRDIMEDLRPKHLIIEPSGVALPSSIIMGLKRAEFWDRLQFAPVIGVIDLTFCPEILSEDAMGNFFRDQILNSDIILLNKADLVTPEIIEESKDAIFNIQPSALILPTIYCQTELPRVTAKGEVTHLHYSPQFNAEVFTFSGIMDSEKLHSLLSNLESKEFGNIIRAKGIVRVEEESTFFDYVHGLVNFGQIKNIEENKFIFIGRDIHRTKLENAIRKAIKVNE